MLKLMSQLWFERWFWRHVRVVFFGLIKFSSKLFICLFAFGVRMYKWKASFGLHTLSWHAEVLQYFKILFWKYETGIAFQKEYKPRNIQNIVNVQLLRTTTKKIDSWLIIFVNVLLKILKITNLGIKVGNWEEKTCSIERGNLHRACLTTLGLWP